MKKNVCDFVIRLQKGQQYSYETVDSGSEGTDL